LTRSEIASIQAFSPRETQSLLQFAKKLKPDDEMAQTLDAENDQKNLPIRN
jgi:hypothetical protein